MASPTQWTWVWVNSKSWWWTGKPVVLESMESQRVGQDWATELKWTDWYCINFATLKCFERFCRFYRILYIDICAFAIMCIVLFLVQCSIIVRVINNIACLLHFSDFLCTFSLLRKDCLNIWLTWVCFLCGSIIFVHFQGLLSSEI